MKVFLKLILMKNCYYSSSKYMYSKEIKLIINPRFLWDAYIQLGCITLCHSKVHENCGSMLQATQVYQGQAANARGDFDIQPQVGWRGYQLSPSKRCRWSSTDQRETVWFNAFKIISSIKLQVKRTRDLDLRLKNNCTHVIITWLLNKWW